MTNKSLPLIALLFSTLAFSIQPEDTDRPKRTKRAPAHFADYILYDHETKKEPSAKIRKIEKSQPKNTAIET